MTAILGINCFSHDTSACLVVDGAPVAIGEEERFNRDQHTKSFPDQAIEFCLSQASMGIGDVDVVAFAHRPFLDFARGGLDALRRVAPKRLAAQAYVDAGLLGKERAFRKRWRFAGRLRHVGHHQAHAASAYFSSPFEESAVLTLDRGGDFLSTTLHHGQGTGLRPLAQVANPHSLGEIYTAVTGHLGFRPNADEGKVMGLAPYGRDRLADDFRDLLHLTDDGLFRVNLAWFRYHREGRPVSRRFVERYGPAREPESTITEHHEDIAYAVQDLIEAAGLHVAGALRRTTGSANLCLAGGVALNSVMNALLLDEAGFDRLFVQPLAADAGNSLGAALWVWHVEMGKPRSWRMEHAFWGSDFTAAEQRSALEAAGVPFRECPDPHVEAARLLDEGKVVGWFAGRAEVGPRALGARSILADARRPEMKDVVNERVKRREGFRPFAPAVLEEDGHEYFERFVPNPFMLLVLPVAADKRAVIPAVTHVDGSGRLQSVSPADNPSFHRLITEFRRLTGVPVVLNTSFNVRGEPIVCRPAEAVADYLDTSMHALFLGPYLAEK